MKKYIQKIFIILFLFFGSFFIVSAISSDQLDINLIVNNCNYNGICESESESILSCPSDCSVTANSSGSLILGDAFINLTTEVDYNKVIIKWKSFNPTRSNLRWGINPDYKDGILQNINYLTEHRVEINNLKDGTIYYFGIESQNILGKIYTIENQIFQTLFLSDNIPPNNPTKVKAIAETNGILVSWENPLDKDFDYVRVMRNTNRYYGNPLVGNLVYEGSGKYFFDSNVKDNQKYYYSLFSRDKIGNYSSGALVSAIFNPLIPEENKNIPEIPKENIEKFSNSYKVFQNSLIYDFNTWDTLSLSGDIPVVIKTKKQLNSKDDSWIEIRNFNTKEIVSQYFFSSTKDENGEISVIIPSFEREGLYSIIIYKYNQGKAMVTLKGEFDITKTSLMTKKVGFSGYNFYFLVVILSLFIILTVRASQKK